MYDYVYHILLCVMTRPSSSFVDYPTFVRTQMSKRGVVKRIRYRAMMFYREILLYAICFADEFIVICRQIARFACYFLHYYHLYFISEQLGCVEGCFIAYARVVVYVETADRMVVCLQCNLSNSYCSHIIYVTFCSRIALFQLRLLCFVVIYLYSSWLRALFRLGG